MKRDDLLHATPRLAFGRFALLTTGLQVEGRVTEAEWLQFFNSIRHIGASLQWVLGDWLVYGERTWGKTYDDLATITGIAVETLYQYAYVARAVEFSIRIEVLTFAHHQLVAALPADQQAAWLRRAAEEGWTVAKLRAELNPSAPVDAGPLAQPEAKRAFQLLWRAVRDGDPLPASQIATLRAWLDDLEAAIA